jgi:hypothetical protein
MIESKIRTEPSQTMLLISAAQVGNAWTVSRILAALMANSPVRRPLRDGAITIE